LFYTRLVICHSVGLFVLLATPEYYPRGVMFCAALRGELWTGICLWVCMPVSPFVLMFRKRYMPEVGSLPMPRTADFPVTGDNSLLEMTPLPKMPQAVNPPPFPTLVIQFSDNSPPCWSVGVGVRVRTPTSWVG